MNNPWVKLPMTPPYVLPEDKKFLDTFSYPDEKRPHTEILPAPYMGWPDSAKVLLLSLNPGFKDWDVERETEDLDYDKEKRKSLTFQSRFPWFVLDPSFVGRPGYLWWQSTIRMPIEVFGIDKVAHLMMVVQYFPYQSAAYKNQRVIPSQHFSFELVRGAMEANKLIIQFRGDQYWYDAVPELGAYENKIIIKCQSSGKKLRKASISAKNMSQLEWGALSDTFSR